MTNKVVEFAKEFKTWIIVGVALLIFTIILVVISRSNSEDDVTICNTNADCCSDEYCFLNECRKKCKSGDCDPGYTCDPEKGCVGCKKCQIDSDCGGTGYYCIDGNCVGHSPPNPPEPLPECGKPPKQVGMSVNNIIFNFLRTGIDPSKLIVGLPAYGRSIGPVLSDKDNGLLQSFGSPGTGPPSGGRNGIFKYIELVEGTIPGLNLTLQEAKDEGYYHTDPIAKVPYIYIPKADVSKYTDEVSGGGLFMSTVDADSIAEKANFVKKEGLGGVLFWDMSGDDDNDTLLTSASTTLKAGMAPTKIIGYYPQWGPYPGGNYFFVNPPANCPSGVKCRFISDNALKNYTHINYAFFSVSYDITYNSFYIDTLDPWADFGIPYKDQKAQDWPKNTTCIVPELGSKNCPEWKPNKVFKEDWTCWNSQNAGDDSNIRLCQTGGTTTCPPNTPLANSLYCNLTSKGKTKPQFRGNIGALKELRARATKLGNTDLKIMMSVGGWYDSSYFTLATNQKYREQFVKSIVSWVTAFDFDGVDIDWEYPTEEHCKEPLPSNFVGNHQVPQVCQSEGATSDTVIDCMACGEGDKSACQHAARMNDPENYLAFFVELRKQLDAVGGKTYVISAAAPAFPSFVDRIDIKRLGDSIDFLNIMIYDINGAFNDPPLTNFNAPLYNTCVKDSDCLIYNSDNININSKCWEKECVECTEDADCKNNIHGHKCDKVNHICYCDSDDTCNKPLQCNTDISTCASCLKNEDCFPGEMCTSYGRCAECQNDSDCPALNKCNNGKCLPFNTSINSPVYDHYPIKNKGDLDKWFGNWPSNQKDYKKYGGCGHDHCPTGWEKTGHTKSCKIFRRRPECSWKEENYKRNFEECCAGALNWGNVIDASKCYSSIPYGIDATMPWSIICDKSKAVQDWCGRRDPVLKQSNLIADPKCAAWCTRKDENDNTVNANAAECDTVMREYCKGNNSKECACVNINSDNEYYNQFMSQIQNLIDEGVFGDDTPSLENPVCWLPDCFGNNLQNILRTSDQEKIFQTQCKGKDVNICAQVINVSDSHDVNIDDVTWNQVCAGQGDNPSKKTSIENLSFY